MAGKKRTKAIRRVARGHFAKGNPPGPGRPKESYRAALKGEITPEKLAKVVNRLMRAALKGSVRAAEVLIKLALGNDPRPLVPPEDTENEGPITMDLGLGPGRSAVVCITSRSLPETSADIDAARG